MDLNLVSNSIASLKRIPKSTVSKFQKIGIFNIEDLITYFPFRYEAKEVIAIKDAIHNEKATFIGSICTSVNVSFFGKNKVRLSFQLIVEKQIISAVIFNQLYLKNMLITGHKFIVVGKWDKFRNQITVTKIESIENGFEQTAIDPVYHTTSNFGVTTIRKWIARALDVYGDQVEETLPNFLIKKYRLLSRPQSLKWIHCPNSMEEVHQARRRLVYEELLIFQLRIQLLKKKLQKEQPMMRQKIVESDVRSFIRGLSFELTGGQKEALEAILADLKAPLCMNRLLQGGVGSGKTIVSLLAAIASASANFQVAIMVPTEILAEQHFQTFKSLLKDGVFTVDLLTARISSKKKKECLHNLETGQTNIVVGTHALIQQDVKFNNLGLVIIDEQHRFGVKQRERLYSKGALTNVLFMTATPIPRTLALTVFGEMDISTIRELPRGRKEIITKQVSLEEVENVFLFLHREIKKGRQVYVVCPQISESESEGIQNVMKVYTQFQNYFTEKVNIACIHGRLAQVEREQTMSEFKTGKCKILIATTVVEVGVDVPNASCIVIYNAERFGLAQLHQLRGRVGRGEIQSYCILIGNPKNEIAVERLQIMTETNDGFYISERDLDLRGHGDVFGYRQSGLPEFKLADVINDFHIMEVAQKDACALLDLGGFWEKEEFSYLRHVMKKTSKSG